MPEKTRNNKIIFGILLAIIAVLSLFISFAVVLNMIRSHSFTDLIRTICSINEKLIIPLGSIALAAYSILSGIIAEKPLLSNLWLFFVLLPTLYIGGVLAIAFFGDTSVGYLFGELFLYCVILDLILLLSSCIISLIAIAIKSSATKWNAAKPVASPEKMRKRRAKFYYKLAVVDAVFSLALIAPLVWAFSLPRDTGYGGIVEIGAVLVFSVILSIIHGAIGYIKARNIFIPNLILVGTSVIGAFIPFVITFWLIVIAASFTSSIVTMLIVKLREHIKNKNKAESPDE